MIDNIYSCVKDTLDEFVNGTLITNDISLENHGKFIKSLSVDLYEIKFNESRSGCRIDFVSHFYDSFGKKKLCVFSYKFIYLLAYSCSLGLSAYVSDFCFNKIFYILREITSKDIDIFKYGRFIDIGPIVRIKYYE